MTRSVSLNTSLNFSQRHQKHQNSDQIEAFDGETAALKQFCFHVRSYGTCGDFTPYVPSPTSQNHKHRKCLTHIVAEHETLAGIALKYDISVEDIRRINSFLWTSNSVWVGQIIKVPVSEGKSGRGSNIDQTEKSTSHKNDPQKCSGSASATGSSAKKDHSRRLSAGNMKIGPSPTEFWTKVDHSIEESRKVTSQLKKNSPPASTVQDDSNVHMKC